MVAFCQLCFKEMIMMTVPNFVTISQTVGEIGDLSIFQNGGRPPSWICSTCVWTTHEEHFVLFVAVQNLAGIDAILSIICKFLAYSFTFTFAICYRPSVCRLSVVCNVRAPYSGGSNLPQYFFDVRYLIVQLPIH